jgi:hypothetical protein
LLAWWLIRDEARLVQAAAALSIAGAVQGAAALLQLAGVDSALFGTDQFGRYTGFAGHPNDLGATLAITLPISFVCLYVFRRRRLLFVIFVSGFFMNAGGILLSGSLSALAGGVLGLAASLAILGSGDRRSKRWTWLAVAGVGAGALILAFLDLRASPFGAGAGLGGVKDPRTRLSEVLGGSGTLASRLETIDAALEDIADNPVVGLGFDHGSTDVFEGGQVHSMPILAWQGGGLPVLLGLCGIVWLSWRVAWPGRTPMSSTLRAIRSGAVGAIAAMVINGLAQPFLYKRFGWIPVALVFSPPILSAVEAASRRSRRESTHGTGIEPMSAAGIGCPTNPQSH